MSKLGLILLAFALLIGAGVGFTQGEVQVPTVTIASPLFNSTVDTNQLIDVSGSYGGLPDGSNILVQLRLNDLDSDVDNDPVAGERTLSLDGSGTWTADDMDFNLMGFVEPGTPGNIIAYGRAGDGSVLAVGGPIDVIWGTPATPTATATVTTTTTPTATATLTATATATATASTTATATPSATRTATATTTPPSSITITTPVQNSIFPTGVVVPVAGVSTNLFANGLVVRALNANSDVLAEANAIPDGAGNWLVNLLVNVPTGTRGSIYAFATRPGDGMVVATSRIDVTYGGPCVVRSDWFLYIVQAGDTLFRIANRVGSTINELALGNCLANTNVISTGQELRVPRLPAPPPTTTTTFVRITSPQPNAILNTDARITVTGIGRSIAGSSIVVRALTERGDVIAQQVVIAGAPNASGDSGWQSALTVNVPATTRGLIYAYAVNANGVTVADAQIPVTFSTGGGANTPAPTRTPGAPMPPITGDVDVIIDLPVENRTFVLASPTVRGRVVGLNGGEIVVRLLDTNNAVYVEQVGVLLPDANGEDSTFEVVLPFADPASVPAGTRGTVYAYIASPEDGSVVASDAVNVVLNQSSADPYVTIIDPLPYAVIPLGEPLIITGYGARLFEGTVIVRVSDDEGNLLAETATTIDSPDAGTGGEGNWQVELDISAAAGTRGSIHAFATSAQDGSIIAEARRLVTFGDPTALSNFVQITTPLPGSIILPGNALTIAGRADLNSGDMVTVQVVDDQGNILLEQPRTLNPVEDADYGTWTITLELSNILPQTGITVIAFTTSAVDGSILASDSVNLLYDEAGATG